MKHIFLILLLLAVLSHSANAALISFDVNKTIPDGDGAGLSDRQTIGNIGMIASMTVALTIAGGFNGDLYCYLRHGNDFCVLLNRPGRTGTEPYGYSDSGFDVTFSDGAAVNRDIHSYQAVIVPAPGTPLTGTWQPDGRNIDPASVTDETSRTAYLNNFYGKDASGEWTLFIADLQLDDGNFPTGVLQSWGLDITPVPEPVNVALGIFGAITLLGATFRACLSRRKNALRSWLV
jgi:subtilisin-like proprotein convertase family protein